MTYIPVVTLVIRFVVLILIVKTAVPLANEKYKCSVFHKRDIVKRIAVIFVN